MNILQERKLEKEQKKKEIELLSKRLDLLYSLLETVDDYNQFDMIVRKIEIYEKKLVDLKGTKSEHRLLTPELLGQIIVTSGSLIGTLWILTYENEGNIISSSAKDIAKRLIVGK